MLKVVTNLTNKMGTTTNQMNNPNLKFKLIKLKKTKIKKISNLPMKMKMSGKMLKMPQNL